MGDGLRIIAIVIARNGEAYVRRCIEHLLAQEVEIHFVDHGSTDRTRALAEGYAAEGSLQVSDLPFEGDYGRTERLARIEEIVLTTPADWFIICDIDEIMEAPSPFRTLRDGIEAAHREGYNVVNFEEFVFLPTSEDEDHEGADYVETMRHYYFFEPSTERLMRAFRRPEGDFDVRSHGGHSIQFEGRRIDPQSFVLRHYIGLSRRQLVRKYLGRVHPIATVKARRWSANRAATRPSDLALPERSRLRRVTRDGEWDRSDPWRRHEFLGNPGRIRRRPGGPALGEEAIGQPPMPVIVGVGRSGTTLLRLMLDSHPAMAIPPETHFVPKLARLESPDRKSFLRVVTRATSWGDLQLDRGELRAALDAVEPFTVTEGLRAIYRLYARGRGKQRWGDKTPRYNVLMDLVASVLPEARFIHLIRDGRDVALSLRSLPFGPGERIEDQAVDWMWRVREARQLASGLPHYLEIRYEDLVREPERSVREACRFVELSFDPAMLAYHHTAGERIAELGSRTDQDGSEVSAAERRAIHSLTASPPDASRIGRWQREMTVDQRREFEAVAGDMLRDLGYET